MPVDLTAFDPLARPSPGQQQPQAGATSATSGPAAPAPGYVVPPQHQHQHQYQQQHPQMPQQYYAPAPAPAATHSSVPAPRPRQLNANQVSYLEQQGFSSGLIRALATHADATPARVWILDNSEAMVTKDSHRITGSFQSIQNVATTRWEELQDCVAYHAQAAALFLIPIRFALVNDPGGNVGPAVFGVGETGPNGVDREIRVVTEVMTKVHPSGPCPLAEHVAKVQRYVSSIAPQLRRENRTATVVLATQGLPTDANGVGGPAALQEFIRCLRTLEGLPVWIVVRLCTDCEQVFDFYNSIDAQLDLPYDVLDDFFGEGLEVFLRNPWLTYGLPLHRFREFGFRLPILDAIDERALAPAEVRELCSLLFSSNAVLPDPNVDWNGFLHAVASLQAREKQQWNPVKRQVMGWIDLSLLNQIYGPKTAGHPAASMRQAQHQQGFQQQQHHPNGQYQQTHQPVPQMNVSPQQPRQFQQQPSAAMPRQHPKCPAQSSAAPSPPQVRPMHTHPAPVPAPPPPAQSSGGAAVTAAQIKKDTLTQWALEPPSYQALRPIDQLLGSVQSTFPPAFGVERHVYFEKWKPFSVDALSSRESPVLKRAVRKMKFFLHPDKLPKDFNERQSYLCKMLWDVIADSWETFEK